jgi:hypothetical protein
MKNARKFLRGNFKPEGIPRINWDHQMAQGLVFYGYDTGRGVIDLCSGRQPATIGAIPQYKPTAFGMATAYNNLTTVSFPSDSVIEASMTIPMSAACAFTRTSQMADFARPFCRTANDGASLPFENFAFQYHPSPAFIQVALSISGNTRVPFNVGIDQGTNLYTTCAVTVDSVGSPRTYFNGAINTLGSAVSLSNYHNQSNILFSGSAAGSVYQPWSGAVFWGAIWDGRTLSQRDNVRLHTNPYDFLIFAEDDVASTGRGTADYDQTLRGKVNRMVKR